MNKCIILLQNKLLDFYFELKLQVRKIENISLSEICRTLASCCAVVTSTHNRELAVSRVVVGVRPMILSMGVRPQTCACVPFIALKDEDENLYKIYIHF